MKKNLSWKKEENGRNMSISFMDGYYVLLVFNHHGPDYHCYVKSEDYTYILSELANVINCYETTFGRGSYKNDKEFMKFVETFFTTMYGEKYRDPIKNIDFVDDLVETFRNKVWFIKLDN